MLGGGALLIPLFVAIRRTSVAETNLPASSTLASRAILQGHATRRTARLTSREGREHLRERFRQTVRPMICPSESARPLAWPNATTSRACAELSLARSTADRLSLRRLRWVSGAGAPRIARSAAGIGRTAEQVRPDADVHLPDLDARAVPEELRDVIGVESHHVELVGRAHVPKRVDWPQPPALRLHPGRRGPLLRRPPVRPLGPPIGVRDNLQPNPLLPVAVGMESGPDPFDGTCTVADLASW